MDIWLEIQLDFCLWRLKQLSWQCLLNYVVVRVLMVGPVLWLRLNHGGHLRGAGGFKETGLRLVQERAARHPRPKAAWRGPHRLPEHAGPAGQERTPQPLSHSPRAGQRSSPRRREILAVPSLGEGWGAGGAERGSPSAPPPGSL